MKTYYGKRLASPIGLAVADLMPCFDGMLLTRINTPKAHRGKGVARALLIEMLHDADRDQVTLYLEVSASDGLSHDELDAWYRRYGFVTDQQHPPALVRVPLKKEDNHAL